MSANDFDPFAFARQGEDDAELVTAERRLRELRAQATAYRRRPEATPETEEDDDKVVDALYDEIWPLFNRISYTPPATLIGVAVKLRLLDDEFIGVRFGGCDASLVSLRQILDFAERDA
jgi:hypothetical protein